MGLYRSNESFFKYFYDYLRKVDTTKKIVVVVISIILIICLPPLIQINHLVQNQYGIPLWGSCMTYEQLHSWQEEYEVIK